MSNNSPEYGEDIQRLLLSYMLADPTSYSLSQTIIKPEYFDNRLGAAVEYIQEFSSQHKILPTAQQVEAYTGTPIMPFGEATPQHAEWYLKEIEGFCRYRALELVVLEGVDLLAKGEGAQLEKRVKDAMTISLTRDLGSNYFENPLERLRRLQDKSNYVSTGWKTMDKLLRGGFTKGSLNIFAGGSGSGKSLFLQNLAVNYVFMGMNVIYITLELSEDLVNQRLDSMVTGIASKDVMRDVERTANQVRKVSRDTGIGELRVKKFPEAGTTCNDLRAFMKEYEIQTGRRPDVLVVDYLDLMHPNNARIDVSSLFTKDKYVSEELRALGSEWDIPVISASQLNRQSVDAQEFDHSHIAGGISKINTADNVFAIMTSLAMRENGVYKLQFLKTRSAGSVGYTLKLGYDFECLRITDHEEEMEDGIDTGPSQTKTMQMQSADQIRGAIKAMSQNPAPKDESYSPPWEGGSVVSTAVGNGPITSRIANPAPPPSEKHNPLARLMADRLNDPNRRG